MNFFKRIKIGVLCLALILPLLMTGCKNTQNSSITDNSAKSEKKFVNLIYYTIDEPDKDLRMVNDKINELLSKKIGVTITYNKVSWQEYESQMVALVSSNTPFDVVFANDYAAYAQKGAWLCLDDYLKKEGSEMYKAIDPVFWKGVRMMDGKIYGVPTNKELAVPELWIYPTSLIDKYQIDINKYRTLDSLEPLLKMIKEKEPDYEVMELDKNSHNFFSQYGYEYIVDKFLPLMIKSTSSHPTIVNIFETEEGKSILYILRKYYKAGYINTDAAVRSSPTLEKDKKVFWRAANGGPYAAAAWSRMRGYQIQTCQVTDTMVTTESTRGGVMAVNAKTQHPAECVKFLNLLNTDAELRNLFNYGIEGVHYVLDSKGQVVHTAAAQNYAGVQYTQGNWFLLKTQGGSHPDPLDKWEQFKKFNAEAIKSPVLGFTPDLSKFTSELSNMRMIWEKYYPCLMTGSVDVDVELPKLQKEMKQAGIDKIEKVLQQQLNQWLAAQ